MLTVCRLNSGVVRRSLALGVPATSLTPVRCRGTGRGSGRGAPVSSVSSVDLAYVTYETAVCETENLPPLIILHGLFGSKSNWTSMSKAIHKSTGRKIIAIDARNHGDSPHSLEHTYKHMVEDVVTIMKKLNVPTASVLGHSMGGRTAMLLSLMKPELVSSLIIADISPIRTSPNIFSMREIFNAMSSVSIPEGVPMSQARKLVDSQLAPMVSNAAIRSFIITNLVQNDRKNYEWRVNLPVLRNNFELNIATFPECLDDHKYSGSTLFIGGGNSDYICRDELPYIRNLFPTAELTYIEGAGHWVHSEKPETFLKLVCDFLIKF